MRVLIGITTALALAIMAMIGIQLRTNDERTTTIAHAQRDRRDLSARLDAYETADAGALARIEARLATLK